MFLQTELKNTILAVCSKLGPVDQRITAKLHFRVLLTRNLDLGPASYNEYLCAQRGRGAQRGRRARRGPMGR